MWKARIWLAVFHVFPGAGGRQNGGFLAEHAKDAENGNRGFAQ